MTTGLSIRPFDGSDRDYAAFVGIWNAIWPDGLLTEEELRYRDSTRDRKYFYARVMAELGGEIVAMGSYLEPFWSYAPGKYLVLIRVKPSYQRRGIGSALYDYTIARLRELPKRPVRLQSSAREDHANSVKFLTDRGFEQKQRQEFSRLDVASFDPKPFADSVERFERSGLVVKTLEEFEAEDPDAWTKLYEKFKEFMEDVPSFDERTAPSLEQFRKNLEGPPRLEGGFLLVFDGGQIVATTSLWKRLGEPGCFGTGLTAVVRSHRRRGIATAIKVRAIEYARSLGAAKIGTDNEESNPMYDLNVRLGFRPTPAWLTFEKALSDTDAARD